MEDIIDLIVTDSSPADISDSIKNAIFAKASERVDSMRPFVSSSLFNTEEESE